MAGLANGWNINELHRGFGQLFVGLALPADGAVMAIDFPSGNPDATANPSGFSVGYTSEGWEFTIEYTSEERRVNEEETPVADFITETTARITGTMAQVRNLDLLSFMLPGSVYSALLERLHRSRSLQGVADLHLATSRRLSSGPMTMTPM
jgi:hypothetical protein